MNEKAEERGGAAVCVLLTRQHVNLIIQQLGQRGVTQMHVVWNVSTAFRSIFGARDLIICSAIIKIITDLYAGKTNPHNSRPNAHRRMSQDNLHGRSTIRTCTREQFYVVLRTRESSTPSRTR